MKTPTVVPMNAASLTAEDFEILDKLIREDLDTSGGPVTPPKPKPTPNDPPAPTPKDPPTPPPVADPRDKPLTIKY
jgi:hypothetical protein